MNDISWNMVGVWVAMTCPLWIWFIWRTPKVLFAAALVGYIVGWFDVGMMAVAFAVAWIVWFTLRKP